MKRYSISNIVKLPHYDQVAIYNEQVAVVSTNLFGIDTSQYLFSIDAFVIGYILDGHSVIEINNVSYDLDPGCIFILTPTHTCRLQKHNHDFKVRLLLLNSNEYNLSVHLSYIVKSEQWMKTYLYLISMEGVLLFPVVMLLAYFNLPMENAIVYVGIVVILGKILSFYKTYVIFFRGNGIFLQNFLYFCALEMTPLASLWGVLVIINSFLKVNF